MACTNTAESFFALLKRGHYGVFHKLSRKHLHRYCNEFGFRWTERKVTDGERMVAAINGGRPAADVRVTYGLSPKQLPLGACALLETRDVLLGMLNRQCPLPLSKMSELETLSSWRSS